MNDVKHLSLQLIDLKGLFLLGLVLMPTQHALADNGRSYYVVTPAFAQGEQDSIKGQKNNFDDMVKDQKEGIKPFPEAFWQKLQDIRIKGLPGEHLIDGITVKDTRLSITKRDSQQLPFSAIVHILTEFETGPDEVASGFIIEGGLVVTAGHVLFSPEKGLARNVVVTPACRLEEVALVRLNRLGQSLAFSQVVSREGLRVNKNWRQGQFIAANDYGAILLPDAKRFKSCGHLHLKSADNDLLRQHVRAKTRHFVLPGFPLEKGQGLWFAEGRLLSFKRRTIRHLIDTTGGQSGSPIIAIGRDPQTLKKISIAFGVHSKAADFGRNFNVARRFDKEFMLDIADWKRERLALQ